MANCVTVIGAITVFVVISFVQLTETVSSPPIVIPTTTTSPIIHKLSGTSATLGFTIEAAFPVVQTSNIVWTLEKNDSSVQTLTNNSTGRHFFSLDFLSLTIDPLVDEDEGRYVLTASNEAGSGESSIYLNIGIVPVIEANFTSSTVVLVKESIILQCVVVQSDPLPNFTWYFSGQKLTQEGGEYVVVETDASTVLTVLGVTDADAGEYVCVAENALGTANASTIVEVQAQNLYLTFLDLGTETMTFSNVDEGTTGAIALPSAFYFGKSAQTTVYLSANGFVSVGSDYNYHIGQDFPLKSNKEIIAPYWDDIDMTKRGQVTYVVIDDGNSSILQEVNEFVGSRVSSFVASWALVARWEEVCSYKDNDCINNGNGLSTFQVVVTTDGNLSVAVFTYQCGMLNLETSLNTASIGFSASLTFYKNHQLSKTTSVNSIACLNSPVSEWSNVIYQISEVTITVTVNEVSMNEATILEGENVTLRASGSPPITPHYVVQWSFVPSAASTGDAVVIDSSLLQYSLSGDSLSLHISNITPTNRGSYIISVTNSLYTANTTVSLDVSFAPTIIEITASQTVPSGEFVTLVCIATGNPPPSVQWVKDSIIIISSSSENAFMVTNTVDLESVTAADAGTYVCEASNHLGSASLQSVLVVQVAPVLSTSSETHYLIGIGDSDIDLIFIVNSDAFPLVQIDDVMLEVNGIEWTDERISIQLVNSTILISISHLRLSDAGNYTVAVTTAAGMDSAWASLTVHVPPVLAGFNSSVGLLNSTAVLMFSLNQNATPSATVGNITIELNGSEQTSKQITLEIENSAILVSISQLEVCDGGNYTITVATSAGVAVAWTYLTVEALPTMKSTATNITVGQGEMFNLTCTTDGIPLPINVMWLFSGDPLKESNVFSISEFSAVSFRPKIPAVLSVLVGMSVKSIHSGSYQCLAKNKHGYTLQQPSYNLSVVSDFVDHCATKPCLNGATCVNTDFSYLCHCTDRWAGIICDTPATEPAPPVIVHPPRQIYEAFGSEVNLTCIATGVPQPSIAWYRDEILLPNQVTPLLLIQDLSLDTRGLYKCVATNELDSDYKEAFVKIKGLVQYLVWVNLSAEFVSQYVLDDKMLLKKRETNSSTNYTATPKLLEKAVDQMNGVFLYALDSADFFKFELWENYTNFVHSLLDPLPLLLTLVFSSDKIQNANETLQMVYSLMDKLVSSLAASSNLDEPLAVEEIIRYDGCVAERTCLPSPDNDPKLEFCFDWPETDISQMVTLRCPCGPDGFDIGVVRNATRRCGGNFYDLAQWEPVMDADCNFSVAARSLCQLAFLTEPDEQVEGLDEITEKTDAIQSLEVSLSTVFMEDLPANISGNLSLSETFLGVLNNLLLVDEQEFRESNEEARTSGRLLQSFEEVVTDFPILNSSEPSIILETRYAAYIEEFSLNSFSEQTLNVSYNPSDNMGIFFGDKLNSVAVIYLPASLLSSEIKNESQFGSVPSDESSMEHVYASGMGSGSGKPLVRLTQAAFVTETLFLRRNQTLIDVPYLVVGSVVVSVSVPGVAVEDLEEPVVITLWKNATLRELATPPSYCSFWIPEADEGYGNWSFDGCTLEEETEDRVVCACNHLTSFAILMDVAPVDEPTNKTSTEQYIEDTLAWLTILGCCVSTVFLTVIIVTYIGARKLRKTTNGCLLINLSFALVGLYVSFIVAFFSTNVKPLCVVCGFILNFFFLASLVAMAAEAVVLYIELVIVFRERTGHLGLKAAIVTWVTPLFYVGLNFAPDYNSYASLTVCRPFNWQLYTGYIIPFTVIYLFNFTIFFVIIYSLICKRRKVSRETGNEELRLNTKKQVILSLCLSLLFGLGWVVGVPATESFPVSYLRYCFELAFIVLVGFQGFFIFIMYGVRLKNVQITWKKWFYILIGNHDKAMSIEFSSHEVQSKGAFKRKLAHDPYVLGTFDTLADSADVELKHYTAMKQSTSSTVTGSFTPAQIHVHSQSDSSTQMQSNGVCPIKSLSESSPNQTSSSESCSAKNSNVSPGSNKEVLSLPFKPCTIQSISVANNNSLIEKEDDVPEVTKLKLSNTSMVNSQPGHLEEDKKVACVPRKH